MKKPENRCWLQTYIQKIHSLNAIEIIPVDETVWMESIQLDWDHIDPADRVIVATAKQRSLPILTKDQLIREFYPHQGWDNPSV